MGFVRRCARDLDVIRANLAQCQFDAKQAQITRGNAFSLLEILALNKKSRSILTSSFY